MIKVKFGPRNGWLFQLWTGPRGFMIWLAVPGRSFYRAVGFTPLTRMILRERRKAAAR